MGDWCAVEERVEIRRLARTEFSRVGEIDRTERIDLLYEQRGTELVERPGTWSASAWDANEHGEHSVEAKRHELEHYVDAGGMAFGPSWTGGGSGSAWSCRICGPRSRSSRSCTSPRRSAVRVSAASCPASSSKSPTAPATRRWSCRRRRLRTRCAYQGRGYELMTQPLPELFEREPEDVHMRKVL